MTGEKNNKKLDVRVKELERDLIRLKQAEEALKENEERYRILTEKISVGVALIQDGRFVFINRAFISMFGFDGEGELIGKEADKLFETMLIRGGVNFFGPFYTFETGDEFKRMASFIRDDREKWVEANHNVIKYMGREAVLSVIRDTTERRLREIEIQEETAFLREENISLKSSIKERYRFGDIIGISKVMQEVYTLILKAANSNANVAIYGESGTGKELVAKAIHDMSARRNKEFVTVNCGAIPEELLESEFFGHKKGAFTGAYVDKDGYLDLADGGSLFLDEVGELSINMQIKLLRTIDGGGYLPVGSNKSKKSDFRIISATNQNLKELVKKAMMRDDFFYRIHVIPLSLPPLRERREDISLLIDHFLRLYSEAGKPVHLPGKVMEALYNYHWPGNIRELKNVIQRYVTLKQLDFMESIHDASEELSVPEGSSMQDVVESTERSMIAKALKQTKWNRSRAAEILGISRKALYRKIKKYETETGNMG